MGAIVRTNAKEMHTKAVQHAFDFSVMTCYAIEALRAHLQNVESGEDTLITPHYYRPYQTALSDLKKYVAAFEANLAAYMLLSVFSFFEAFVKAIIDEVIQFHGGIEIMIDRAENRDRKFISSITREMSIQRYKLRTKKKPDHEQRYRKYTKLLQEKGFRFPTETFSSYGIRRLANDLSNLRAHGIPDFLIRAFHVPLDPGDMKYYQKVRGVRNQVAHGHSASVSLKEVSRVNDLFRRWTILINEHFLANYFVIEDYS